MTRLFLALLFTGFYSLTLSQTSDTLYYDNTWKPCQEKEAKYYRLTELVDGVYQIRDFYTNGVLQMEASATSIEPEIFNGACSYYHPNGNLESTGVYYNGHRVGIWKSYNAKGRLTNKYDYGFGINNKTEYEYIPEKVYKKAISEADSSFSIALRGKVFGFFVIEDCYFSTATLGTEFLIKGKHSFGLDYTYFGWQYETDDSQDNPLYETYERRGYLYLDYKYCFLEHKDYNFYFNAYDKIGGYHMWQEGVSDGYNSEEKPFLNDKTNGKFNQVGCGLGFKRYVNEKFYFDLSVNGGKVFANNHTSIYNDSLKIVEEQYNVKSDKYTFYIRINFGYKIYVKKRERSMIY